MDRARAAGTRGARRTGDLVLRRLLILLILTAACDQIIADFDRVVAIEIVGPTARTLEEGDTLQLEARAISAGGETVPDAQIYWAVVDTGPVGFSVDTATGLVTGTAPGTGRVQPRVDELRLGAVTITVTAAADSLAAGGDTLILVDPGADASPPLAVLVLDLTTAPGESLALAGQPVHFSTADPPPGSVAAEGFFLARSETAPGDDPHAYVATTGADGRTDIVVRRQQGAAQPDTAVIHAVAVTAAGDTVAGSPIRFRIRF